MGFPTSEVGYTSATTGRGYHEVHKGHVVALGRGHFILRIIIIIGISNYYFPYRINQFIFAIEMQCVFCDVQARRSEVRFPAGARDFPLFETSRSTLELNRPPSQNVSGTSLASQAAGT
jgi:hypothetical protein